MVNYLDSRRIAGTTAERSSIPTPATSGGWVELGRTTLGSAGDSIDVTSLADKRYYMVLSNDIASGSIYPQSQLNGDTGLNYSSRRSANGGADTSLTGRNGIFEGGAGGTTTNFSVTYVANYSTKEKLGIRHTVFEGTSGAGNAPAREEIVGKHAQTSNPISSFKEFNTAGGDYNTGSEVVVLGWDPSDTHTTNFWEELADVTLSSAGDTLSSGTITAKKYLWVQAYLKSSGICGIDMTFNNDTGSNYARRGSNDGGADFTSTSSSALSFNTADTDSAHFFNMFIINNASNEKLGISHGVTQNTAGAGNAPERKEQVHKWANTSNQITKIDINNSAGGDYDVDSFIKVWGSD